MAQEPEDDPAATLEEAFRRSERMVARRIADEYLLVPLVGRGANLDSIFSLNRVAAFVWERLDGRASGREIVAALTDSFDVTPTRAAEDYLELLGTLLSLGAVARG